MISPNLIPARFSRSRALWLALVLGIGICARAEETNRAALSQPQRLHAKGIENFFQLSSRIYSGSVPENDDAFAALQKLGIKTIITVDGAKPDVESARKFGLRYVHLPIGYDGVPAEQALKLIKAAETLPQPIFVHCHHGFHRGPAGAAVICEGTEQWTPQQAIDWLKLAGTATNYSGLYKSVAGFHPPSAEQLKNISDHFPEKTEVSTLVDMMIEADGHFDNLKLIQKAGYQIPSSHPDLNPAQEALLLEELFKELNRSGEGRKHSGDFQTQLDRAEKQMTELRAAMEATTAQLSDSDKMKLAAAFDKVAQSCTSCHKAHRN